MFPANKEATESKVFAVAAMIWLIVAEYTCHTEGLPGRHIVSGNTMQWILPAPMMKPPRNV